MKFWEFKNELNNEKAELLIYKEIASEDWWDEGLTTPKKFYDELKALGGKDLVVRINSCGGDVFAAQAIYNQLKTYTGNINVRIDGIAASAATIIACAGEKVIMPSNTIYMIHNPMNLLIGYYNEGDLSEVSKSLKIVKQTIVNVYKMKCKDNIKENDLIRMMDEETYLTADEAKKYGFVDEIDTNNTVSGVLNKGNLIINSIDLGANHFKNPDKILEIVNKEHIMENNIINKLQNIVNGFKNSPKNNDDLVITAKKEERERILALNKLKIDGNETINNLIDEAIADETATADKVKPYLDKIIENVGAKNLVQNMVQDSIDSGVNSISANPQQTNITEDDKAMQLLAKAAQNCLKNKFGGK